MDMRLIFLGPIIIMIAMYIMMDRQEARKMEIVKLCYEHFHDLDRCTKEAKETLK